MLKRLRFPFAFSAMAAGGLWCALGQTGTDTSKPPAAAATTESKPGGTAATPATAGAQPAKAEPAKTTPAKPEAAKPDAGKSDAKNERQGFPPKAPLTRDPYLQLATQNSIHIVWRTRTEIVPSVRFGVSLHGLNQALEASLINVRMLPHEAPAVSKARPLHSAPTNTRQFEALLTGLTPDTKYYYAVYDGANRLTPEEESYHFRTLPVPGTDRAAWMWVAGDGGTGGKTQAAVHKAMMDFTGQHKVELDLFLHVGDMAYTQGLDSEFQGRFFQMYSPTLRNTVCWPAMGNHEGRTSKGMDGVGPYYDCYICPTKGEAGGVPSGREAYYSFDYGRIHFIVLDSCDESMRRRGGLTRLGNEMMEWLKADLEKAKADWLIAYWHHPPYTKGSHDSDHRKDFESIVMREKFMPLLESAGVDLVLAGHSHIYERSMLIDGAYATPTTAKDVVINDGDGDPSGDGPYRKSAGLNPHEGTVNIVTGNAGTTLKRLGTSPIMKRIILEHGSVLLNVKGDSLRGLMLNKEGQKKDVFEIVKRGKNPILARVANPKAPPPMDKVTSIKSDGGVGEDSAPELGTGKLPRDFVDIIPRNTEWRYLVGDPPVGWASPGFNDANWLRGRAGFGYGDNDDVTKLDMRGKQRSVYIRREFVLTGKENLSKLGLVIAYDDGFVAYVNGVEAVRSENVTGVGAAAKVGAPHEAGNAYEYIPLEDVEELLKPGRNILAIEGHNDELNSSDFSLNPALILER